jgi:hypothetical protein
MARANRETWERESFLDDLRGEGIVQLNKHKFIYLAEQTNMCPSVLKVWQDHWREYIGDQNDDINILMVSNKVILWLEINTVKNGNPQSLSRAIELSS